MTIINTLKIYEELRTKFDDEQAKAITGVVEKSLEEYKENEKDFLVTKIEFKQASAELRKEMADLRAELIKWMFIFWAGQIGVITGILFAFFK